MKSACTGGRFICCTAVGSTGIPIQSYSLPPPGMDHLPEGCWCSPPTPRCPPAAPQEVSVEDVEQLMADTAEAKAYEDHIRQLLGG